MILAGDVGGTKTNLALFDKQFRCLAKEKYQSQTYHTLSEVINLFLSSHKVKKLEKICLGIAGPIEDQKACKATNLPWFINADEIKEELKISEVFLINDLEAIGYGINLLKDSELHLLNDQSVESEGNRALIAAGTGLGEAGLYWDGVSHHPFASEGGHVDFSPRDDLEIELLRYLREKFGHVSYERILSGPGIYNLYSFLIDKELGKQSQEIQSELRLQDPAKVITKFALENKDPTCMRTLEWFISIYGSEAGNLALKLLPFNGVYIGGGIAPKILRAINSPNFIRAFVEKGRFSNLLSKIPIKVILNENTALLGAAYYGIRIKNR